MDPSVEVVMRPPEVFVRALAPEEALRLKRISKQAKHQSDAPAGGDLAGVEHGHVGARDRAMWMTDESHVRKVIHEFNERGFDSLDPDYRGGRPRRITRRSAQADRGGRRRPSRQPGGAAHALVAAEAGRYLAGRGSRSRPRILRLLAQAGLSLPAHALLEGSPDPDFAAKAERVLSLYERAPEVGW